MTRSRNNKLTIKKIVSYCPSCCEEGHISVPKKTTDLIVVARECPKHQPEFVKTGTGIMVPEAFLDSFNEMHKPVSLSSQEI